MLRNYLTTGLRSLLRNRSYTLLNLLGLTSGITVCMLITIYVFFEFSFDTYHAHKERIYRVVKEDVDNYYMGTNRFGVTPAPLAPTLMEEYPEVEAATRISPIRGRLMGVRNEAFLETAAFAVDPETFEMFSFDIVYGKPYELLNDKNTAVLSRSLAEKYFGNRNPIGEVIRYRDEHPFVVTGVIEDMPTNSHFRMDIMLHYVSVMEIDKRDLTQWGSNSYYTYLLLRPGSDAKLLEAKFPALREKHIKSEGKSGPRSSVYFLEPLTWIHLHSQLNFDIAPPTDINRLYIAMSIALLILIIACINYINLATAKALTRWKEVGVRKSIGAQRQNLVGQFLSESLLLAFSAVALAVLATHLLLPYFADFVTQPLALDYKQQPEWIIFYAALGLVIGVGSGFYPAFLLSAVRPVAALKGITGAGAGRTTLRNLLVVAQFAISGILIIVTLVVSNQMNYIQSKDMGFVRDQVLIIDIRDPQLRDKLTAFKEELKTISGVLNVTSGSSMPNEISSSSNVKYPGRPEEVDFQVYTASVDPEFINLFELQLAEGRGFDASKGDNARTAVINEALARELGWDDPLNRELINWSGDTARIIGVLKDFNQHSLHLAIEPMQLFLDNSWHSNVAVRFATSDRQQVLLDIEKTYRKFSEKYPFEYAWFDDVVNKAYLNDTKTATMANYATLLTVIIACLGLYALAMHSTEQRMKEVGIRKILGASVSGLMLLLSRTFLGLVVIAFVIAMPVAWWMVNGWLASFAYHVRVDLSVFVLSLGAMLLIGGLTISYRTLRAARKNPVEVLKVE